MDNINASASPEVQMNDNFIALAPGSLFGRMGSATSGLTWGYYGGIFPGSYAVIADDTVVLTDAATNYIECDSAGVVYTNTSAFTAGRYRLYSVVCAGGVITSYTDYRTPIGINVPGLAAVNAWTDKNTFNDGTSGLIVSNAAAPTKLASFDLASVTAGQNRVLSVPDANIILSGSAAALTSGRMPRASTGGLLIDDANSPTCDASGNVVTVGTVTSESEPSSYVPTLTCSTSGTITTNGEAFDYVRHGNLITISGRVTVASVSSPVGILRISVPVNSTQEAAVTITAGGLAGSSGNVCGRLSPSTAYFIVQAFDGNNLTNTLASKVQAGSAFVISATYFVT